MMALISPISIVLYFYFFSPSGGANLIPQHRAVSGLTTLDASNCAIPSCTVTPTALTSITITPSPVTVLHPPGAITPVVLIFDPITIASFQPRPTVLANNGDGILTLGTATLSSFKATATASYLVLPSDAASDENLELDVAVVANVEAEAQLFFAFNNDNQGICDLFPGAGISGRSIERFRKSRSLRRGLLKRHALLLDVSDSDRTWIEDAIEDSKMVLSAISTRLKDLKNDDDTFKNVPDKGLNDYWHKDELQRLLLMVNAQIAALDGPDEVVFTSFDQNTQQRTLACSSDDDENNLDQYGATKNTLKFPLLTKDGELKNCEIEGFTCFCPLAINQNNPLLAQNDQTFCIPENRDLLTKRYWDFNKSPGSRAHIIIHELTHFKTVATKGGFPMLEGEEGDLRDFANNPKGIFKTRRPVKEIYAIPRTSLDVVVEVNNSPVAKLRTNRANREFMVANADNYAYTIVGWYLRSLCGWNL